MKYYFSTMQVNMESNVVGLVTCTASQGSLLHPSAPKPPPVGLPIHARPTLRMPGMGNAPQSAAVVSAMPNVTESWKIRP